MGRSRTCPSSPAANPNAIRAQEEIHHQGIRHHGNGHSERTEEERDQTTIQLDRDVLQTLEHHCRYLESGRDYVINQCLAFIFRKDKPFTMSLASQGIANSATIAVVAEAAPPKPTNRKDKPGVVQGCLSIAEPDSRPYLRLMLAVGIGVALKQHFPFIGTLMKQDFQRAILKRIPMMEFEP